jgi:cytochrome c peroxidase
MAKTVAVLSLLSLVMIMLTSAISQQKKKTATQADSRLWKDAQTYFQPLPKMAVSTHNTVTTQKILLGKTLYYDSRLSITSNSSCNSCHPLSTYGADRIETSEGGVGKVGVRNAPTTLNAALHIAQFWDGRAANVEEQSGMPILNADEMAMPNKSFLVSKLKKIDQYTPLFKAAFPAEKQPITFTNVQQAIGAFERTLLTPSRFDKFLKGDMNALTTDEKRGLRTFLDIGCKNCHNGVGVGGGQFQRFGLFMDFRTFTGSSKKDEGRKNLTGQSSDKDIFKVPSLRNITQTYPYFHDGKVDDLTKAIRIMGKVQLNKDLRENEVNDIILFLNTLTGEVPAFALDIPKFY